MKSTPRSSSAGRDPGPVVVFGIGIALFVLYVVTIAIGINSENDFVRESWGPYRLLTHGHLIGFIRTGPGYTGSLILRAPFAFLAALFGWGWHATYIATAIPCLVAPALLAGWLASARRLRQRTPGARRSPRHVWPLDLFMLAPPAWLCINGGHPEDILGAALCVAAVLCSQRGSTRWAAILLGLALINKPWALVIAPLVIALMPPERRLEGLLIAAAVTAAVMVPVEVIRLSAGGRVSLGQGEGGLFLVPQLWWVFGPDSWFAREAHYLLVAICWLVTALWSTLRTHRRSPPPTPEMALLMLALVLFLRAALDPWDNGYYFAPFMLSVMALDDRGGFPWLSWIFAITILVVVPVAGVLHRLGNNGHAAVFAVWAIATIVFFARRAFSPDNVRPGQLQAAANRSGA